MDEPDVQRAVRAAMAIASALGLAVEDAIVVHNSNKLAVRLLPCDTFARIAHAGREVAEFEMELAQRLGRMQGPLAALEPRVAPRPYESDGFVITLWTYYDQGTPAPIPAAEYANALEGLHAAFRTVDIASPHFTDRVDEAMYAVRTYDATPPLLDGDRVLLVETLEAMRGAILERGVDEQLLHDEPHPGNVLSTKSGLVFIDLETCCRGPVEFDLAHVPQDVSDCYPGADRELLGDCRLLVLAMVAAWRLEPGDQLPNGQQARHELIGALHDGPPWPPLDVVMRRAGYP